MSREAHLDQFIYFTREEYPYSTSRSLWRCGALRFLVSSINNPEMNAVETMVFEANEAGEKVSSEDLAFIPTCTPTLEEIKEAVVRAYNNKAEKIAREVVEDFVRYEATIEQLKEIKDLIIKKG